MPRGSRSAHSCSAAQKERLSEAARLLVDADRAGQEAFQAAEDAYDKRQAAMEAKRRAQELGAEHVRDARRLRFLRDKVTSCPCSLKHGRCHWQPCFCFCDPTQCKQSALHRPQS